jgi:hypothetical protein
VPRKHKRRPEEPIQPLRRPQGEAPMWALVPWAEVRRISNEKPYRCPGCDLEVRPLVWHFVVVPVDDPDERRHWHEGCWRVELNRTRGTWRGSEP